MARLSVRMARPRHCLRRLLHRSTVLRCLYASASKLGGRPLYRAGAEVLCRGPQGRSEPLRLAGRPCDDADPHTSRGIMRTRLSTAVVTAAALLALTGCGAEADPAACKAAMAKAFDEAIAAGDTANSVKKSESPAACDGVDDETVQRFAAELISDRAGKAAEDVMESAAP